MASSAATASKDEWRARFEAYRRELTPEWYAAASAIICARTAALQSIVRSDVIHIYWPMPDEGEVDTRPLIQMLRTIGATVVLPVITSYDPASPTMEHRKYEGPSALETNRWGLREPKNTLCISPDKLDVVVVPGLGADREGTRLGRGAGYYDNFLRTVDVPRILLTYSDCLVDSLPAEPHDVPVTTIVTERGVTEIA